MKIDRKTSFAMRLGMTVLFAVLVGSSSAAACSICHPGCENPEGAEGAFWEHLKGSSDACRLVAELIDRISREYGVTMVFVKPKEHPVPASEIKRQMEREARMSPEAVRAFVDLAARLGKLQVAPPPPCPEPFWHLGWPPIPLAFQGGETETVPRSCQANPEEVESNPVRE